LPFPPPVVCPPYRPDTDGYGLTDGEGAAVGSPGSQLVASDSLLLLAALISVMAS